MKIRIIAILILASLMLSVFTACGGNSGIVTGEEAQQIALEAAGLTANEVSDVHTHVVTEDGIPCYSVHITHGDTEYSYVIEVATGKILSEE